MLTQLVLVALLSVVGRVEGGCYQKRLCCPGRNVSCSAIDDGIEHLPFRRAMHTTTTSTTTTTTTTTTTAPVARDYYPSVYDDDMNRIGSLVYPDVIEFEGSGTDFYDRYGDRIPLDVSIEPIQIDDVTTTAPTFKRIVFGEPFYRAEQPNEITRARRDGAGMNTKEEEYSLLNQHIPITVGDFMDEDEGGSLSKMMYLNSNRENICYCDEMCISFGDCCSDYTFVCPPSDCYVTNWAEWSKCEPDDSDMKCGSGVQTRTRDVRREAIYGGAPCPALVEKMSCFEECPHATQGADISTVALLLDYQYNKTREKLARDNIYWDLPEVASKVEKLSYYCVSYKIGWVNRNCVDKKITEKLHTGNTICAECQPESQLHRNNLRCASDLDDGEHGFWKLIGPKSCNGIWTRLTRTDNCKCEMNFPSNDSFLLV